MDMLSLITPMLKTLLYLASFGAVGTFLFILHFDRYQSPQSFNNCESLMTKAALIGAVVAFASFVLITANMGGDVASVFDPVMVRVAVESKAGMATGLAFLGFILMLIRFNRPSLINALGAIFVMVSFTLFGHATKQGILTQALLFIHLVTVAFWLGSLIPFWSMCYHDDHNLHKIAHRFGVLAIRYIIVLIVAGQALLMILVGFDPTLLFGTTYGLVFLVKILSVVVLLALGALNKFRLVPMLADDATRDYGRISFKRSVQFEMLVAIVILSASSVLTTLLAFPN